MKKIIAVALILVLVVSMTACGTGAATSGGEETAPAPVALTGEIAGEITVSCYDAMRHKAFLEQAAALFEEEYPGTKVNVEVFSSMPEIRTSESGGMRMQAIQMTDDPQARMDYINKVNTSMMSDSGADLLAMDVLPFQKYVDGGQLADLSAFMEADPDFNRSDYRQNILDAVVYKNGTWFLPLDYSFTYYTYDSTLLEGEQAASFGLDSAFTVQQLVDLAAPAFDGGSKLFNLTAYTPGRGMGGGTGGGLFGTALAENYAAFVDVEHNTANFTDGSFVELLENVKDYEEKGYIPQSVMGQRDAGAVMGGRAQEPTARYFYKSNSNFMLQQLFNKNSGRRMMIAMAGVEPGIDDDDEIAGLVADKNGNVPFTYGQAYGINANSKNMETAWAFLKFLLSKEMQLSTNLMPTSLPIHNAAREEKAELILSGAFMAQGNAVVGGPPRGPGGESGSPEFDEVQQDVLDNYRSAVERFSDQINTYTVEDSIVNDMIAAEVQGFFSGEKSAEEVASTLQSKVDLYLNELGSR